jgi:GDPmannose 4,6-dehydratase
MIIGSNGQDGHYLSELLKHEGWEVLCHGRPMQKGDFDLRDFNSVSAEVNEKKPAFLFHLAANSTTRHDVMFENHATICTGTINVLEAVRLHSPDTKVFVSGSGLQFRNDGMPINEQTTFEARDPYSVSRIHSVYAARYFRTLGIKTYVGYFFNHDSPLRSSRHVSKKITDAVNRIAGGSKEMLEIGDVEVVKEWGFAGDIVQAIWTLVNNETHFEAVLGTGDGYSIREWLQVCFDRAGLRWQDHVKIMPDFKAEYGSLVSNPSLIRSLGWQPKVSFEQLAEMMMKS